MSLKSKIIAVLLFLTVVFVSLALIFPNFATWLLSLAAAFFGGIFLAGNEDQERRDKLNQNLGRYNESERRETEVRKRLEQEANNSWKKADEIEHRTIEVEKEVAQAQSVTELARQAFKEAKENYVKPTETNPNRIATRSESLRAIREELRARSGERSK